MASLQLLKTLVTQRLTAAVEEILELVERVMVEQEAELTRQHRPTDVKQSPRGDARPGSVDAQESASDVRGSDDADLQQQVKEEPLEFTLIKQEELDPDQDDQEMFSAPPVQVPVVQTKVEQDSAVAMPSVDREIEFVPCEVVLMREPKIDKVVPNTSSEPRDGPSSHPHVRDGYSSRTSCSCKVCGMQFSYSSLSSLMKHAEVHADDDRCLCGVCGKLLPDRTGLLQHLQAHINIYVCYICRQTFPKRNELWEHKCSFVDKKLLRGTAHSKKHPEKKAFSCSVCTKTFKRKCALILHSRVHKRSTQNAEAD